MDYCAQDVAGSVVAHEEVPPLPVDDSFDFVACFEAWFCDFVAYSASKFACVDYRVFFAAFYEFSCVTGLTA